MEWCIAAQRLGAFLNGALLPAEAEHEAPDAPVVEAIILAATPRQ